MFPEDTQRSWAGLNGGRCEQHPESQVNNYTEEFGKKIEVRFCKLLVNCVMDFAYFSQIIKKPLEKRRKPRKRRKKKKKKPLRATREGP